MLDAREYERWLRSALRTLESARADAERGDHNWACFKAQQAGELAVKGLLRGLGEPAYGRSVALLVERAAGILGVEAPSAVVECAKLLDKFYIPARYPDAWSEGEPYYYFTRGDSERAISCAGRGYRMGPQGMGGPIEKRRRLRQEVIESAGRWAEGLPGPVTAILVGSYARGDFNLWSDVDVLLVSPRFRGVRVVERLLSIDSPPGYEVIAWTPEEYESMLRKRNPLALEAAGVGVVLRDDLGITGGRPPRARGQPSGATRRRS